MKEKAKDTNLYDFEKDMGKIEEKLAEWTGLEPATLGVTGRYSNQLNYHSKPQRHDAPFGVVGGVDGTRTRDPRRDRPIF